MARVCQKVGQKTKIKIIPVVSGLDFYRVKQEIKGEVWLQKIDPFLEGAKTGWVSALQAMKLGAAGSLINHSEHKIPKGTVSRILTALGKEKIKDFKTMVCFRSKGQAGNWLGKLKSVPDFVAYEPPELIGGQISVSQAKPETIKEVVKILSKLPVIVGAGVHCQEDVKAALKLGAKGILVSSAVVKAKNPEEKLLELAEGF